MEINASFFKDEVRDGFYVSGYMKHFWAAQLEVLRVVDEICDKHQIPYFAAFGTLLGAVRHKGYIPWDDDLDICMLRSDYERFLQVVKQEVPDTYQVLNCRNSNYYALYTRIVNTGTIRLDAEFVERYYQIPYPVGIDLFVLDYVSADEVLETQRDDMARIIYAVSNALDMTGERQNETIALLTSIEEMCHVKLDPDGDIRRQLCMLIEDLSQLFDKAEAKGVSVISNYMDGKKILVSLEQLENRKRVPFEYTTIPIMDRPQVWLSQNYGEYQDFYRAGGCHGYPLYEQNEQALMHLLWGKSPFTYEFSLDDLQRKTKRKEGGYLASDGTSKERCIVFLCCRADQWKYFEPIYQRYVKDENNRIWVVVVPYYERKMDGRIGKRYYELEQFDCSLPIFSYENVDLKELRPDCIFTQNGFDFCNQSYVLDERFYTSVIKEYTDRLIYAVPFQTYEIAPDDLKSQKMMQYYVSIPGIAHCDYTIVQSEHIRKYYIAYLTKRYGEATRSIWDAKIVSNNTIMYENPFLNQR